jgi:hypothetical protein
MNWNLSPGQVREKKLTLLIKVKAKINIMMTKKK